jgi:hypothetical protein
MLIVKVLLRFSHPALATNTPCAPIRSLYWGVCSGVKCTLRQAEIPQCRLFISKRCTGNEGAKNLYLALNQKRYEPQFALPRVIPSVHTS